jgi:UDPglucose--hexose-1-phosphate uridylyltransferase
VRAFPNKYPGGPHHEVIAEGELHCQQPAELDESYWCDVCLVWQRRIRALEQRPGVRCAFLFKNVGALAGASIVHNHSQLLGLPELPPRLQLEHARAAVMDRCPWCAALASADDEGRMIFRGGSHVVLAPTVPRLPNETWLLPLDCEDDFLSTDVASLGQALHRLFCAVQRGLGSAPFNLWLHRVPGGKFHWHFEMQPRSGQLAGLELGGDMYINSVPPAHAAARLRAALTRASESSF